jgi:hypothetical protein
VRVARQPVQDGRATLRREADALSTPVASVPDAPDAREDLPAGRRRGESRAPRAPSNPSIVLEPALAPLVGARRGARPANGCPLAPTEPGPPELTPTEPGSTTKPDFDGVRFLRAAARARAGGKSTPEAEVKLREIQSKLERLAADLERSKDPAERARLVARAFLAGAGPTTKDERTASAEQRTVVGAAVALVAALSARAALSIHALPHVIGLALGMRAGGHLANEISAELHHALDNYGFDRVPVLAEVAREFQHHHLDPVAVTKESWALTAYSSAVVVVPVVAGVLAAHPGVAVDVAVGTIALAALMGQEGHKMVHRPPSHVPIIYDVAQLLGLVITKNDHATHHVAPYEHHYAMISGNHLEDGPRFRRREALIYRLFGVEPNSWKLNPRLRVEALGARGYDGAAVAALALRDAELAALKARKQEQDERLQAGGRLGEGEARVTLEDVRAKAAEIPDPHRVPPDDHAGAAGPILNLRVLFTRS